MSEAIYDEHAKMYVEFIDRALAMDGNPFSQMLDMMVAELGSALEGARVLDVACGEGYVSRFLAGAGAREVVGIDLSAALIDVARARTDAPSVTYLVEDAQRLTSFEDGSFDAVVSQMAVMDIPDHRALFAAVRRVLRPGGPFVFTFLHPCFESPYYEGEDRFPKDDAGEFTANVVRWYATEGPWKSPASGGGVRSAVGSHHRMLSTYVNDLIAAGFTVRRMEEPLAPAPGLLSQVPRVMLLSCVVS